MRTVEKQFPELRGVTLDQTVRLNHIAVDLAQLQQRFTQANHVNLHAIDNLILWQVSQPRQTDLWVNAATGETVKNGSALFSNYLLIQVLKQQASPALASTRLVPHFKADKHYGFIDKRLPVTALDFPHGTYYIDTRDAVLSVKVDEQDKAFAWVFRNLHKWRFADGLGLNGRGALISTFILLISCVSLLGLKSWLNGRKKRAAAKRERC